MVRSGSPALPSERSAGAAASVARGPGHAMLGSGLLALVAAAVVALLTDEPPVYFLALAQLLVALAPVVAGLRAGRFDPFELIHGVALSYFVFFGGKAIYVLLNPFGFSRAERIPVVLEQVESALLYSLLGMVCLLLGYYSPIPRAIAARVPRPRAPLPPKRAAAAIVILYVLGTGVRAIMYYRSWYMAHETALLAPEQSAHHPTLLYFSYLCVFAYALAGLHYFGSGRPQFLVLWLLTLPGEALYLFLTGSKFLAVIYLAVPPFGYHYFRRRIPARYLLIPAALFVFVVFPVVSAYRGHVGREDIQWQTFAGDVVKAAGTVARELREEYLRGYVGFSVNEVMERAAGLEALTNFIDAVPDYGGFLYGEGVLAAVNALIPTPLRPEMGTDRMAQLPEMLGLGTIRRRGGLGITQMTELYWNFGLAGILGGMFLLGVLYRGLYLVLRREREPIVGVIYLVAWWNLVLVERWFWAAFPQAIKMAGILLLVTWAMRRGVSARGAGGPRG